MSIGKYLSLEEARKKGLIARFCKAHPSKADRGRFTDLLDAVTGPKADQGTSAPACRDSCSETQTPSGTSKSTS